MCKYFEQAFVVAMASPGLRCCRGGLLILFICATQLLSASGDCPNDCSGHGNCNPYGMCVCYRYFNGPDCSLRKCPFGKAIFNSGGIDLNRDGDSVDSTDLGSNVISTVSQTQTCAERAWSEKEDDD